MLERAMAAETARRVRLFLYGVAALASLGLAVVALAHTNLGRPLLSLLPGRAGCPLSVEASPKLVEAFRSEQLARRQGARPPRSRPALAFELGKTTRAEVIAWAEQRASCSLVRQGQAVHCRGDGSAKSLELPIADLYSHFDGSGHLVALDVFRVATDPATALKVLGDAERRLDQSVGPSTLQSSAGPNALQRPMSRVSAEYRYAGYVARVSATHLGKLGIRVREQYQAASSGT
jgi:hypothetical protein